jgi:hypothetical protein
MLLEAIRDTAFEWKRRVVSQDESGSGVQRARIRRPRKNGYTATAARHYNYVVNVVISA